MVSCAGPGLPSGALPGVRWAASATPRPLTRDDAKALHRGYHETTVHDELGARSRLVLTSDNHNSVNGSREFARARLTRSFLAMLQMTYRDRESS